MALDNKIICCFMYFLTTVSVYGLDLTDLELDKTLNPRLIGAVYHLYKPIFSNNKGTPITIDCNHPSVICKFGTSTLVTSTNKECNCKDSTGEVPIITGLTTGVENKDKTVGVIKTEGDTVSLKPGESDVPIYKGVVDTDAILNEADNPYNIWNFQRNSLDKGWRPVDDPTKTRVGELPRKFYSYYPFSQPPATDDFSMNFPPSMSGQPHFHPNWRRPGATSAFPSSPPPLHRGTKPQFSTSTIKNPPIAQNLKTNSFPKEVFPIADKVSTITPKSAQKSINSAENSKSEESSTSKL